MALCMPDSDTIASKTYLFDMDRASAATSVHVTAYRCRACGDEVAYDSLAACCRCSEECYADGSPAPMLEAGG